MDLDALDRDDLDSDDPGNDVFDLDGLADGLRTTSMTVSITGDWTGMIWRSLGWSPPGHRIQSPRPRIRP